MDYLRRLFICCIFLYILHFTECPCYANYEDIGCGARAPGMGNAFTSVSDDVSAIYYNPAGLIQLKSQQFLSEYSRFHWRLKDKNEVSSSLIGYVYPHQRYGYFGIGWTRVSKLYREDTYIISYGRDVIPHLSLGLNAKILSSKVNGGSSVSGYSMDLGCLYKVAPRVNTSLVLKDITQPDMGLKEKNRIPLSVKIGTAYKYQGLNIVLDNIYRDKSYKLHLGAEKRLYDGLLGIRCGSDIGEDGGRNIALGIGCNYGLMRLDYGLILPLSGIEGTHGTHRFSLGLTFGEIFEKAKIGRTVSRHFAKGMEYYQKGKFRKAVSEWKKVLSLHPEHKKAISWLNQLAERYFRAGVKMYQEKRFMQAVKKWNRVVSIIPDYEGVKDLIKKAKREFAERIERFYEAGIERYNKNDYLGALSYWEEGLRELPGHHKMQEFYIKVRLTQGIMDYRENKLEDAIKHWEKVLELEPKNEGALKYLKRAKTKQERLKELGQ